VVETAASFAVSPSATEKGLEEDRNGGEMETTLDEEIRASLVDGRLPCAQAFRIAKKLKVAPREVGDAANRLQIKIASCQLGCFP
jgi:hypothetical protein